MNSRSQPFSRNSHGWFAQMTWVPGVLVLPIKEWYAQYWVYAHDAFVESKQLPTLNGVNSRYCTFWPFGRPWAVTKLETCDASCAWVRHTFVGVPFWESLHPLTG